MLRKIEEQIARENHNNTIIIQKSGMIITKNEVKNWNKKWPKCEDINENS